MNMAGWIREVDALRAECPLLAAGQWHGYAAGPAPHSSPMVGRYYLIRWVTPSVAVSHDDRNEVVRLARLIETGLTKGAG